ncbi:MAG TPA: hypothetical protein VF498_07165 [Anaerolineales bacterium]
MRHGRDSRGKYACPLLFPQPNGESCPKDHKNWSKGGCTADLPTSIGARLHYTMDREGETYKTIYQGKLGLCFITYGEIRHPAHEVHGAWRRPRT